MTVQSSSPPPQTGRSFPGADVNVTKKRRRGASAEQDSTTAAAEEDDDAMAPPGIDPVRYADALAAPKGRRSPEQREVIKQARIVRNRIAAQTSRDRKRRCFNALEAENAALKARLAVVEAANESLRAELEKSCGSLPNYSSQENLIVPCRRGPASLVLSPAVSSCGDAFSQQTNPTFRSDIPLFPSPTLLGLGEPAAL